MIKFKRFISFVCIAFFALFSAWSAPAQQSHKIIKLKVKAEKIVRKASAKVPAPNFMRTDALVFYEPATGYPRPALLVRREKLSVKYVADSKYIYRPTERLRNIQFLYV